MLDLFLKNNEWNLWVGDEECYRSVCSVLTFDAVHKVVYSHDGEVILQQLDDRVWCYIAATSGHKHCLAAAGHDELCTALKEKFQ